MLLLRPYTGKKSPYDVLDGYQDLDSIMDLLNQCDFYLKRSYSAEKNRIFGLYNLGRLRRPDFNHHVSCAAHPIDKPYWKELIKNFFEIDNNMYSNTYFSAKKFEEIPKYKS